MHREPNSSGESNGTQCVCPVEERQYESAPPLTETIEDLLDRVNAAVVGVDGSGRITVVSGGFARSMGWSAEHVVGKDIGLILTDDVRPGFRLPGILGTTRRPYRAAVVARSLSGPGRLVGAQLHLLPAGGSSDYALLLVP